MLAKDKAPVVIDAVDAAEIGLLTILRLGKDEAISLVRTSVVSRQRLDIAICNAHTILTALDDADYAATLQSMTLFNDGLGANIASQLLHGTPFPENLNGTDLVPALLDRIDIPLRIYLLGAREEQVALAKAHVEQVYPGHEVVGFRNGYFDESEVTAVCDAISAAEPDLLLVAMGNPHQERFIVENRDRLGATVSIGVGALFDFMSGSVVRAPKVVQVLGMEWLFRLLQEPRRLGKRYVIGIPRFLFKILHLKVQAKKVR